MRAQKTDIAMFLPFLAGGGAEKVMVSLASAFSCRGLTVDLLLVSSKGDYPNPVLQGLRVIDFNSKRVLMSLLKLIRYLRIERPAVLLSSLDHANLIALWAKYLSLRRIKSVIRVDNVYRPFQRRPNRFKRFLITVLCAVSYVLADVAVAVSQAVATDLHRLTALRPRKIKLIYNPISLSEISKRSQESPPHPWLAQHDTPVIMGSGRLTEQKDFVTLIRAFRKIRDRIEVKLLILGEGEDRDRLTALIKKLGLEDDVDLPGFVGNPYAYMSRASVFVLSSRWEGCPVVLLEALALRIPIVATDCPGGSRELLDGRYGRLVPPGDVDGLAEAIVESISSPIDSDQMNRRALEFDVDRIAERYLRVMDLD
jgi:glycosyltransferase involved in cell wall biosynthesis